MRFWRTLIGGLFLAVTGPLASATACDVDRPVVIAGLNWDSNAFHAAVASRILKDGYDCQVEIATGATRPLFKRMMRGEIDITMEVWKDNLPRLWPESQREESVVEVGINYPDAIQGWFVPRYLVEGPSARAPGLKSVSDLPRYKTVFSDPEDRAKGRFYNCMLGWGCEKVNTAKLHAYGLTEHFNNFRTASGKALVDAISHHYEREEAFLTYYWGPTWVLGEYDLVMLEEPPYDPEIWRKLARSSRPEQATAYPVTEISIGVSAPFHEAAPGIVEFLSLYRTDNRLISRALAVMNRTGRGAAHAAEAFLRNNGKIWRTWVPAEIAGKVEAALAES